MTDVEFIFLSLSLCVCVCGSTCEVDRCETNYFTLILFVN